MLARRMRRNDGLAAALAQPVAQALCVISPVRQQAARRGDARQERADTGQVVRLPCRQTERDRPPVFIGQGVNFGRPSAARTADRIDEGPPFAPLAERCALTDVLSTLVVPITPEEPDKA